MIVHLYSKRVVPRLFWQDVPGENQNFKYKRFCDKETVIQPDEAGFTSVHHKVTCPVCLDILIPALETKLLKMKTTRGAV